MDLILVFTTFYLSLYLNFNRSGAAGNLIWFFSSPPNRLHSFGNVKYSPGRICPPYQKLKTESGKSCCCCLTSASAALHPIPQNHFRFCRLASTSLVSLPFPQPHIRFLIVPSVSEGLLPLPKYPYRFRSLISASEVTYSFGVLLDPWLTQNKPWEKELSIN